MALEIRNNVLVTVLSKISVDNKEAYKILMPSGLIRNAWASDLIFI